MKHLFVLMAMVAGFLMPVQAGVNATLEREAVGDSVFAAMVSFLVGTLALAAMVAVLRIPWPGMEAVSKAPWWSWTGGLLGAFFVAATIFLAYRLGAATMMAWLIAGIMAGSILMDNYGWLGYPVRPATLLRVLGAAMVVAGAALIRKF